LADALAGALAGGLVASGPAELAGALADALAGALAGTLAVVSWASRCLQRRRLAAKASARVTTASRNLAFVRRVFVIFFSLSSSWMSYLRLTPLRSLFLLFCVWPTEHSVEGGR